MGLLMEAAWQRLWQQGRRLMQLVGRWRRLKQLVGRWRRRKQLVRVQTIKDWKAEWLMLEGTTAQAQLRRLQTIGWGSKLRMNRMQQMRQRLRRQRMVRLVQREWRQRHLEAKDGGSSA